MIGNGNIMICHVIVDVVKFIPILIQVLTNIIILLSSTKSQLINILMLFL
jgi:hypothetical protein